jgi:formate hydrogenlyase subunit 4
MKSLLVGNSLGMILTLSLLWELIVAQPHSPVNFLGTSFTGIFLLGIFLVLTILAALIRRSVPLFNTRLTHFLLYSVAFFGLLNLLYQMKHLVER